MPDKWAQYEVKTNKAVPQDKWAEYAESAPALPAGATGPLPRQPGLPEPEGIRGPEENGLRRYTDDLTRIEPFNAKPGVLGHIETGIGNIGAGFMSPLAMIAHPLDTATGVARMGADAFSHSVDMSPGSPAFKMARQIMTNPAGAAEAGLGQIALGEGVGMAGKAARPALRGAGDIAQSLAAKNATRILDRGTSAAVRDARSGIDPGRAMLESGVGPSLTKASLRGKIGSARQAVGSMIGNAVDRADANALAPKITNDMVRPAIEGPIRSAEGVRMGPGGNLNTTPFTVLRESFNRAAPGAKAPIYGPNADPFIPPSDLWRTIQNVDRNTRFNPDPEVESVNETQREIRSNLRPFLEQSDPTIRPLSRRYSGLTSADEAMERTAGRSNIGLRPGVVHNVVTNTPLNTTLNSGLFRLGGALRRAGGASVDSTFAFAPRMARVPRQLESDLPGNADYGEDFTEGGFPERAPIIPEAPPQRLRLTAQSGGGEIQPMIGVKSTAPPPFAETFARTRIVPPTRALSRTLQPETSGLFLPPGKKSFFALPESVEGGPIQPMILERRGAYPALAEDYARMRVAPTKFSGPPDNPLGIPKALLTAKSSMAKPLKASRKLRTSK